MNLKKLCILLFFQVVAVQSAFSAIYTARFQCGNSTSTNSESFSAANDMAAKNEAMRILNNNSGYRGRGCRLIELASDKQKPMNQRSMSYELSIQCASNKNSTLREYFSADSDLEAENEARRLMRDNSAYRGKGCVVIEMISR